MRPLRVHGLGEMSFDPALIPGGVTGAQVEFETRGFTKGLAHNMVIEKPVTAVLCGCRPAAVRS